jgi:hypothetical protein
MLWAVAHLNIDGNSRLVEILTRELTPENLQRFFDDLLVRVLWSLSALCLPASNQYVEAVIGEIIINRYPFVNFSISDIGLFLWLYTLYSLKQSKVTDELFRRLNESVSYLESNIEGITQAIICYYYYKPDPAKYPKFYELVKQNEDKLTRKKDRESSRLHDGIHEILLAIPSLPTLEKEKFLFGFYVDEYLNFNGKDYIIEINGPIHFLSCRERISGEIKEKIFHKNGFRIINFDYKDREELNKWHRKSKSQQKDVIEEVFRKEKIL